MFDLKNANILVTGANGYVGRNLIAYLLTRGHRVVACSRNEHESTKWAALGCKHQVLDYLNVQRMRSQLAGVDLIFHAAADLSNWGIPSIEKNFNVYGTRCLLDAALGQVQRLVLVSSEAVLLGSGSMQNLSEATPYPIRPIGQYAYSKQLSERMVLSTDPKIMECLSVRPRMVWGRDDTTILPKLTNAVARGRFLWIDHGNYFTSSTHIDNLCEGLYLAAKNGRACQAYFITDGPPTKFREFVLHQLRYYTGEVTKFSLPRPTLLFLSYLVEAIWRLLDLKSPPPIMRSQVYLTGSSVTIDDSLARLQLGYVGKTYAELCDA